LPGSLNVDAKSLKQFLIAHYPLIGVLLGSFLIAASMGTYTNWDSHLEYEAASNILISGLPMLSTGFMINQPPLGFYTTAPIFQLLGLSYLNGIALSSAFGLGSVALVYALGTLLYGRKTGLVASALFGLIPWHVYMSRIFLIDNQCLFWSLLFLVFGVLAVKRNSEKMVLSAGVFFALAFLTKLFAVFSLAPLLLFVFLNRKKGTFKVTKRKLLLFLSPSIILQAIWYGGFANQNFSAVYFSTDLSHPVYVDAPAAYLPIILVNSTGIFLFAASFFAVAFAVVYRGKLAGHLRMDMLCLATVAVISGLNLLLVLGFRLTVPYVSVFKYTYLALPFLCLLAASIADKGAGLLGSMEWKNKIQWVKPVLIVVGLVLVFASLLESVQFLNKWVDYAWFGVDTVTYYPFNLFSKTMFSDILMPLQYFALALVVCSMFLPYIVGVFKRSMYGLKKILAN
jgi:4-amino-4-deoxy-L-arabinose transferase-like glycosyltransferase